MLLYDTRCPNCDQSAVVRGHLRNSRSHAPFDRPRFEPEGLRIFSFFRIRFGLTIRYKFRCCLSCGHLWSELPPERLRAYMKKHGSEDSPLLDSFEKKGADPEIA